MNQLLSRIKQSSKTKLAHNNIIMHSIHSNVAQILTHNIIIMSPVSLLKSNLTHSTYSQSHNWKDTHNH